MNEIIILALTTSLGNFEIELYPEQAPVTSANFLEYAEEGFFENVLFHRVIPGFVIQGGGFEIGMEQKPTKEPIVNEADNGLKNEKYTLSMARTSEPNSATSQFFINHKDNDFLNFRTNQVEEGWGYAVFGKVTEGMDVVDKIADVQTTAVSYYQDVPVEAIKILEAEVID